ncbi:uncharacterized protein [Typha latifolia]|uniref:uncharacterized protein n=1 Tax=Typha latifolia TaxID=4733 RepID=UPI003C2B5333
MLQVDRPTLDVQPVFRWLFTMYDAQFRRFLDRLGMDGNNQMYPLAIQVAEAECKDSWTWFLKNTFEELILGVEHRYYARHLYANFVKIFKGKQYKNMMWATASAYIAYEFQEKMDELKSHNQEAYNWLMKENLACWAKSKQSSRSKSDRIVNNMSEASNVFLKDVRDKPIITMVEGIRGQLMTRYQERMQLRVNYKKNICPKILKKLEQRKVEARKYEPLYAGNNIFELTSRFKTKIVKLLEMKCTCKLGT